MLASSYPGAYFTGEMVWVVPTLVESRFLASSIDASDRAQIIRVDENEGEEGN